MVTYELAADDAIRTSDALIGSRSIYYIYDLLHLVTHIQHFVGSQL